MSQAQKIYKELDQLPESARSEVLDFIEFLKQKKERDEDKEWSKFSLARAMQGIEEENAPEYNHSDIRETV